MSYENKRKNTLLYSKKQVTLTIKPNIVLLQRMLSISIEVSINLS